jgi:hypothetical protein
VVGPRSPDVVLSGLVPDDFFALDEEFFLLVEVLAALLVFGLPKMRFAPTPEVSPTSRTTTTSIVMRLIARRLERTFSNRLSPLFDKLITLGRVFK